MIIESSTQSSGREPLGSQAAVNRALCAAWLDYLGKRGRKPLTVYQYAEKLEKLCAHAGDRPLADLTLQDLENWVDRPRARRGGGAEGSPATKDKDIHVLRGLYGWSVSHGHLTRDVTADLHAPKVRNANPKAISPENWTRVWFSEHLHPDERAVLGLGFFCGLRREEMCQLRQRHFDLGSGRIIGFPRKGDQGSKTSGVLPFLSCARLFGERQPELIGTPERFLVPLEALVKGADGPEGYVLPWGLCAAPWRRGGRPGPPEGMTNPDQINRRLQLMLQRLGYDGRLFSPHALRHSFVTYMLAMNVPLQTVSSLANHSSPTITMRYVRVASDPLAQYLNGSTSSLMGSRWGNAK